MSPQLKSLIWLEWQQRRWQLLLCLSAALALLLTTILTDNKGLTIAGEIFLTSAIIPTVFLPAFVAVRTTHGEVSDNTLAFSEALPVSSPARSVVRLLGGAAVLWLTIAIVAIVTSLVLACGWHGDRLQLSGMSFRTGSSFRISTWQEAMPQIWRTAILCCFAAGTLYLVVCAVGSRRRSEVSVAAWGVVMTFLWLISIGPSTFELHSSWQSVLESVRNITSPLSMCELFARNPQIHVLSTSTLVTLNLLFQSLLAAYFVRSYTHRYVNCEAKNSQLSERTVRWQMRWRFSTPLTALVWLTLRQTLPICFAGAATAWLLVIGSNTARSGPGQMWQISRDVTDATIVIGFLWATMVGSMIFAPETDRRISEFWRAAPISVRTMFVVKFAVGLLTVLLVLDSSALAARMLWSGPAMLSVDSQPVIDETTKYLRSVIPLHAMTFTIAIAATCWLRRPMLAGMFTLAVLFYFSVALSAFEMTRPYVPAAFGDTTIANPVVVFTAMLTITVASGVLAYRMLGRYRIGQMFN